MTGRSYHSAEQLPDSLDLPDGAGVDDALNSLTESMPDGESLPPSCLVIVSGQHLGTVSKHEARDLKDGDELTLIAPVAGG
jgi:molybdopterin converting factor small subunit